MKLSIVTTMYQSGPYIEEFVQRVSEAADKITDDYEIIVVDDGSPDNSLEMALNIQKYTPRLQVIELSRNFGHHKAMMTGLKRANGELVFLIDCDLEEDPELLNSFYEEMQGKNVDVVFGVQKNRKGSYFEKISGLFFYRFFNLLSGISLPQNLTTVRLMKRRYIKALIKHREREILIAGLWNITGFRQIEFQVDKKNRRSSSYTSINKFKMALDGIASFSKVPLHSIFYFGLFILLAVLIYLIYSVFLWVLVGTILPGYTSIVVLISFFCGLIIFFQGIIGIYLATIFSEVKQRPYTIIRKIHKSKEKGKE